MGRRLSERFVFRQTGPDRALCRCTLAALLALVLPSPAACAPGDALLHAAPERMAPQAYVEVVAEGVSRALDFSSSGTADPAPNANTPSNKSGNYRSVQVAGAWRIRDGLWLSGLLGQRDIHSGADTFRYRSWQASGLFRFNDAQGGWPALALRLSAWGNDADVTETTSPVNVPGAILDSVTVTRPSDRQVQADLIVTWPWSPALDVSAALGAGTNRLDYRALAATTTRNGCKYKLSFNGNDIFGELARPCQSQGAVIRQFFDSSGSYGIDVAREIAWRGRFMQAGINADWRSGPWTARGGYLLHMARRDAVDDILARRGAPSFKHNHVVTLESGYRFQPRLTGFVRAQLSSNLFLNDMPVTYNTSTADSFSHRLSVFTLGLRAGF